MMSLSRCRSALFLYQWSNSDMRAVFENEDQEAQEYVSVNHYVLHGGVGLLWAWPRCLQIMYN